MSSRLGIVSIALLFAALTRCRYAPTQVLVALDSDAPPNRELSVTATIYQDGAPRPTSPGGRWRFGASTTGSLPASFAVLPSSGSARDALTIVEIDAEIAAGAQGERVERLRRTARFHFVSNVPSMLRVFLRRACAAPATGCTTVTAAQCTVSVQCEERSLTCGDEGQCVPRDVTLTPFVDASTPNGATRDSSANDAATDASIDAHTDASRDAAVDAGPPPLCTMQVRRGDIGSFVAGGVITRPLAPHAAGTTEVFSFVSGPIGSSVIIEAVARSMTPDVARVLWISDRECGDPIELLAASQPATRPTIEAEVGPGPGGIARLGSNVRYFVHHRTMADLVSRADSCPTAQDCSADLTLRW